MKITNKIGKGLNYYNNSIHEFGSKRRKYLEKAAECGNLDALLELLNGDRLYQSELNDSEKIEWVCAFVSGAEKSGDVNGIINLLFSITERFNGEYIPLQNFLNWIDHLENLELNIVQQEKLIYLINANIKLPQTEVLKHMLTLAKNRNYFAEIVVSLSYLLANKLQIEHNKPTGFIDSDNKVKYDLLGLLRHSGGNWAYSLYRRTYDPLNLKRIMSGICIENNSDILDLLQSTVNNYLNDITHITENQTITHGGLDDVRLSEYLHIMYVILWGYALSLYNINRITEAGHLFVNALCLEGRIRDIKEHYGGNYVGAYSNRPIILDNNIIADALYKCGLHFEQGNGVDRNIESAIYYYKEAAKLNNADALYRCGLYFEQGNGVAVNIESAVYNYKEAAKLDNADAQAALGICYALGNGVPRNEDKARELLTNAAKQDNVRALQFLDEHPELKSGVRNISYHAEGDIIQGNSGIIAKDDAVVNRANLGGDANSSAQEYKFCMYCGEKLPVKAMFCMKCGKKQE